MFEIGKDILTLENGDIVILVFKTPNLFTSQSIASLVFMNSEGEIIQESDIEINYPIKAASFTKHPDGGFAITGGVINSQWQFQTFLIKTNAEGFIE